MTGDITNFKSVHDSGYIPTEPNTLDEQIDELVNGMISSRLFKVKSDAEHWQVEIIQQIKQTTQAKLKALFTEHSKEVDRLARISELEKLPKSEIGKLANHSLAIDIHIRISNLLN